MCIRERLIRDLISVFLIFEIFEPVIDTKLLKNDVLYHQYYCIKQNYCFVITIIGEPLNIFNYLTW